jgi:hypothetical protein
MQKHNNRLIILKGEGMHQHTVYGDFGHVDNNGALALNVENDSILYHEKPDQTFGEHKTLPVSKGTWYVGKQVEYNPFSQQVSRVWD